MRNDRDWEGVWTMLDDVSWIGWCRSQGAAGPSVLARGLLEYDFCLTSHTPLVPKGLADLGLGAITIKSALRNGVGGSSSQSRGFSEGRVLGTSMYMA